jgi:hypothetical protein
MKLWERFKSLKERGEWVELQFMAEASRRRHLVCKPWGDSRPYDVGIEHGTHYLRVQVKSTTVRLGRGYFCQFKPDWSRGQTYQLGHLDLFRGLCDSRECVVFDSSVGIAGPESEKKSHAVSGCTSEEERRYECECYKEAWDLLRVSRRVLSGHRG